METGKGQEKVAMAWLEYNHTDLASDELKLYETRYEAGCDIANERCDDLAGNAKDVCINPARAECHKAKADIELARKVSVAADDAAAAHNNADYKVSREKCDALGGDAKDVCVATAKARYDVRW